MKSEYTKEMILRMLGEYGITEYGTYQMINSSHGDDDIRHNYIIDNRYVLRVNSAPVMTEERLAELNPLIRRYNDFGIHAPYFLRGKDGHFLRTDGENYIYLSEYLDERIADDLLEADPGMRPGLLDQRLTMVAKYAQRYQNQGIISTRSMYSLFDLSPYDALTGIDEKQDNLNALVEKLGELGENALADRFVAVNGETRTKLLGFYRELPCCVFQGDENFSNVCVDGEGNICGLFDFNMSGTDVIANYLANLAFQGRFYYDEDVFETHDAQWVHGQVMDSFQSATKLIMEHYRFSAQELDAYYLYAKIVMISGWVNVCAFLYYLKQPEYREEGLKLLKMLLQSVIGP